MADEERAARGQIPYDGGKHGYSVPPIDVWAVTPEGSKPRKYERDGMTPGGR